MPRSLRWGSHLPSLVAGCSSLAGCMVAAAHGFTGQLSRTLYRMQSYSPDMGCNRTCTRGLQFKQLCSLCSMCCLQGELKSKLDRMIRRFLNKHGAEVPENDMMSFSVACTVVRIQRHWRGCSAS